MVDDVIDLLGAMDASTTGARTIHWPSSSFMAVWNIEWTGGVVAVDARWDSVIGGTEPLLRRADRFPSLGSFIAEWKKTLEIVCLALVEAGYTSAQIPPLAQLEAASSKLPRYGQLYAGGESAAD